jgi:hypothetical protein
MTVYQYPKSWRSTIARGIGVATEEFLCTPFNLFVAIFLLTILGSALEVFGFVSPTSNP